MSSQRDSGSSKQLGEPKLITRGIKWPRPATPEKASAGTQQLTVLSQTIDSDEDDIPSTQPNSPALNGIPAGNVGEEGHRESSKRKRVLRTLCERIEQIQSGGGNVNTSDEIFTMPIESTPRLS